MATKKSAKGTAKFARELRQRDAELEIINTVLQGLAAQLEVQAIYDLVGDGIRNIFNAQVVMISTVDNQTGMMEHRYAIERGERIYAPGKYPIRGLRTQIVETRKSVLVGENVAEIAARLGQPTIPGTITPKTWLGVPLIVDNKVTGVLSLQDLEEENAFSTGDVRFLETLGASMSIALENAHLWEKEKLYRRALERELEIGREIQAGFLPETLPQIKGWEIAASLMSARIVAGDFYDAFELPEGTLGLVIADVCDKGVGAALFMTLMRSLLRVGANLDYFENAEQKNTPHSTAERLQRAISLTNNYITETHSASGMFATLFFGILDPRNGRMAYINGGHLPPLIVRHGTVCEELYKTGPAVGVLQNYRFDLREVQLEPGDLLLAFTDGLPDCTNPNDEFFGRERLPGILQQESGSAQGLVRAIETELLEYISGTTRIDDITLLAVKRQ